jgi:hypothetical protein
MEDMRTLYNFLSGNLKGRAHFEDVGGSKLENINMMQRKYGMKICTGFKWKWVGSTAKFHKHDWHLLRSRNLFQ